MPSSTATAHVDRRRAVPGVRLVVHGFAVGLVLMLLAAPARADNVDRLIKQLDESSDYKVRLSAALNLAKLNNQRAIPSFIKALSDDDKTVRGAAAAALGKLVDGTTKADMRKKALAALEKATKDANSFVSNQAKKSRDLIAALEADTAAPPSGGIYIDVGGMSAEGNDAVKKLMRQTTLDAIGKASKIVVTKWTGGKAPTEKQLASASTDGYHVDGTLNELKATPKGSATIVSCKVNMYIATYPKKSAFGFLNGGASVQASSDPDDIQLAKEDCVAAVVEDLVKKKIVPTILIRSGK
jgi:hypothetical protein